MEETSRRGSSKRTHEESEPERPSKRSNVAQDVSAHHPRTSSATESQQGSSSRSSPATQHYESLSNSSPLLSIDQLVQVQDSNHHEPGIFGRCTSADSISTVDSEHLSTQNKRTTFNNSIHPNHFETPNHVLVQLPQQQFAPLPICACVGTLTSRLPGIQHLHLLPLHTQPQHMPDPDYMKNQTDLNQQMRGILFDWLVEVAEEYKLKSATLFLTISIIDRFLSKQLLTRDKLQLVGISSMLIASKLEESVPPRVGDFVFISDNAYNKLEIYKMEKKIQATLDPDIRTPTIHTFLELFQASARLDEEVCQLSNYLAELTLMDYDFIKYEPKKVAASVIAIALHSTECPAWSDALQSISQYSLQQLEDCMTDVLGVFVGAPVSLLQAVREKYSAPNPYLCVSNISPPDSWAM